MTFESFPTFRKTFQFPSSDHLNLQVHIHTESGAMFALHKAVKSDQPILHIHQEDGNCNACRNVGRLNIQHALYPKIEDVQ
jgi:nitrogen fixation protein FixH